MYGTQAVAIRSEADAEVVKIWAAVGESYAKAVRITDKVKLYSTNETR